VGGAKRFREILSSRMHGVKGDLINDDEAEEMR